MNKIAKMLVLGVSAYAGFVGPLGQMEVPGKALAIVTLVVFATGLMARLNAHSGGGFAFSLLRQARPPATPHPLNLTKNQNVK
jgi:hypothetical protein